MSQVAIQGRSGGGFGAFARRPEAGALLGLVVVYTIFAILGGQVFLGAPGWSSWLNMAAEVGIIALPVGLLMIAGELDISVGAILPASSLTVAIISGHYDQPMWMGIAAALAEMALHPRWWFDVLTTEPLTFASLSSTGGTVGDLLTRVFDPA